MRVRECEDFVFMCFLSVSGRHARARNTIGAYEKHALEV